jgi:hypothetical protein
MHKLVVLAAKDHETVKVVKFTPTKFVMSVMDFKAVSATTYLALLPDLCELRFPHLFPIFSFQVCLVRHRLKYRLFLLFLALAFLLGTLGLHGRNA